MFVRLVGFVLFLFFFWKVSQYDIKHPFGEESRWSPHFCPDVAASLCDYLRRQALEHCKLLVIPGCLHLNTFYSAWVRIGSYYFPVQQKLAICQLRWSLYLPQFTQSGDWQAFDNFLLKEIVFFFPLLAFSPFFDVSGCKHCIFSHNQTYCKDELLLKSTFVQYFSSLNKKIGDTLENNQVMTLINYNKSLSCNFMRNSVFQFKRKITYIFQLFSMYACSW